MSREIIYLDNAASSWPKPNSVLVKMQEMMSHCTANPGRGGHQMAVRASREIFTARKYLAKLFRVKNPNDISFSLNTTMGLNMAIKGFVKKGDHVICSSIEHNSVRRPLEHLKANGMIDVSYIEQKPDGTMDLTQFEQQFCARTSLVVVNHSSNLLGAILPISDISEIVRRKGAKLLVDAAQTAGVIDIDVQSMGIDMLAFPGHKALFGPQGTGGLYVHPEVTLEPLIVGGTGSKSEEIFQPLMRPDCFESGTQNTVGIAGLAEGTNFVLQQTIAKIHEQETRQINLLHEQLKRVNGLQILGPGIGQPRTGLISFRHPAVDPAEMAFILDQTFQIAVRSGFHCTPLAHQTANTIATGAVRASISYFTTDEELESFVDAIQQIISHYH
jgi:cysteine desulfurase family protein